MARKYTTEQLIKMSSDKIAGDIQYLSSRREYAVSSFRRAANDLAVINNSLIDKRVALQTLQEFIVAQDEDAAKMIADNESVRAKILDIIGE